MLRDARLSRVLLLPVLVINEGLQRHGAFLLRSIIHISASEGLGTGNGERTDC